MEQVAELAIGLVAGVLSGMFGVGGGLTTTPLLRLLTDHPALVTVATPLLAIVPTTAVGAATHLRAGNVDLRTGAWVGLAGGVTAVAGAQATRIAGGTAVLVATGVVLFASAAEMFIRSKAPIDAVGSERVDSCELPPQDAGPSVAACLGAGAVAGLASGLLGVGGGFILVPLFTGRFGYSMKRAVGTSLVSIAAIAVPGLLSHAFLGNIDVRLGVVLAMASVPGAWLGARIALGTHEGGLRKGFAALMALSGALLAANEFGWLG